LKEGLNHQLNQSSTQQMNIEINNETKTIAENFSAQQVFELLQIDNTNGYALAINNTVVPKSKWNESFLKENDKVLVIQATQGG
jgi:sulfur carrier protein